MIHTAIPVLAAATCTQFAAGLGFWFFGVLAPELAVETGLNERDFGLSVTFIFAGTFLSSPFTGMIVRRFGGPGTMVRVFAVMGGALLSFGQHLTAAAFPFEDEGHGADLPSGRFPNELVAIVALNLPV